MSARWIAVMAAVGLLAVPALAGATTQLAATDVRFGDHGPYLRVVIDFSGTLADNEVEAGGVAKTLATLRINHPGAATWTTGGSGYGVRASLQPTTQGLNVAMNYAPRKFKYLSYAVVTGNRLAIDLWKNVVPPFVYHSCAGLTLSGVDPAAGIVKVGGKAHGIFEDQFQVVVRSARGMVIAKKHVIGHGSWTTKVRYHSAHSQRGTVEAVAFSPKDGAVACLAEIGVTLPAS